MGFFSKFLFRKTPPVFFVEGNIGSGKTSTLARAKQMLHDKGFDVLIVTEDVERWKRQNLLGDMYENPNRASVRAFQVLGCLRQYVERAKYLEKTSGCFDVILQERHPTTTLDVFAADECVNEMFFAFQDCFKFMPPPTYTVYIKTSPRECAKRIKTRQRKEEKRISLCYLEKLDLAHEDMMEKRLANGGVVYEIDCSNITPEETAARLCDAVLRVRPKHKGGL